HALPISAQKRQQIPDHSGHGGAHERHQIVSEPHLLASFACWAFTASTRKRTISADSLSVSFTLSRSALSFRWSSWSARTFACRPEAIAQCWRGVFSVEPIGLLTKSLILSTSSALRKPPAAAYARTPATESLLPGFKPIF